MPRDKALRLAAATWSHLPDDVLEVCAMRRTGLKHTVAQAPGRPGIAGVLLAGVLLLQNHRTPR